ncbi:hypothetical protein ACFU7X_36105 [Streptomyces chartreusis]
MATTAAEGHGALVTADARLARPQPSDTALVRRTPAWHGRSLPTLPRS